MSYIPPISSYIINESPRQSTQSIYINGQYVYETGSCVATAIGTAVEIIAMRRNKPSTNISFSWIWGAVTLGDEEGAYTADGLDLICDEGAAAIELIYNNVTNIKQNPDMAFADDAQILYNNNKNPIVSTQSYISNSWQQRMISDDYSAIFSEIQNNNKVVIMQIGIDPSFDSYQAYSTGIVPNMTGGTLRGYHCLVIFGWKVISGKYYWICRNSWEYSGYVYGDNGLYYVPFDWTDGTYWTGGINAFYTLTYSTSYSYSRPPTFSWDDAKTSDGTYRLKMSEWGRYEQLLNWLLCYQNKKPSLLPWLFSGNTFKASRFKNILNDLGKTGSTASMPSDAFSVVKDSPVKAEYLNKLRDIYNAIRGS